MEQYVCFSFISEDNYLFFISEASEIRVRGKGAKLGKDIQGAKRFCSFEEQNKILVVFYKKY
jgi:hypothetical protein